MKKLIILISLLAVSMGGLNGCSNDDDKGTKPGKPQEKVTNPHPGVGEIYVIGDSLAYGYKATKPEVTPTGCLAAFYHQSVTNLSVPGTTSQQILDQAKQVTEGQPKLVFISSGGNDVLMDQAQPGSYPAEETLKEMDAMFDHLLATKAVVEYLALNPPVPYADRLPQITQLAYSKGVVVVDGMRGLWQDPTLMSDQIHPNDKGYAIMCSRIQQAIEEFYP